MEVKKIPLPSFLGDFTNPTSVVLLAVEVVSEVVATRVEVVKVVVTGTATDPIKIVAAVVIIPVVKSIINTAISLANNWSMNIKKF